MSPAGDTACDRIAAGWRAVVDATRKAGGTVIVMPALDLSILLDGYEQARRGSSQGGDPQ